MDHASPTSGLHCRIENLGSLALRFLGRSEKDWAGVAPCSCSSSASLEASRVGFESPSPCHARFGPRCARAVPDAGWRVHCSDQGQIDLVILAF